MQKVIDYYFLIVSNVISLIFIRFCFYDNNWSNILLFLIMGSVLMIFGP